MITDAQKRAKANYAKKVYKLEVPFYPTEKDLKEYLDSISEPKATYIKRLIREDIEKQK